jgi:hypothetical protein
MQPPPDGHSELICFHEPDVLLPNEMLRVFVYLGRSSHPCSPKLVEGVFSEVHMQNRAYGHGTPTDSSTSNAHGPDHAPLCITHRHKRMSSG